MIDRYARPAMKRVWSDENKNDKWLQVELAVCEAWAEEGTIPPEDMAKLRMARYDPVRMKEVFERTRHDMTAFLQSVTAGLGDEGRWLHMGLTSHDVQDTAQSLQMVEAADILLQDVDALMSAIRNLAVEHKHTPMMGRTHGVHAEPTTFGLKMALWWDEMRRQRERLEEARRTVAVGKISGVVGTYATVPPQIEERVCAQFGIAPCPVSNQVVQRDRHAHFVTTLALVAASLEKFATEVRGLQRTEVREVEEPFGQGQTGSSAMPHKKNPELSERVCGLARLVRGHSVTALENVALWHERDISHSSAERLILPDSCMALDYIMDIFTGVMRGLRVYPERMWHNIEMTKGLVFSQRVLIALLESGLSRERSYEIVQACAMRSWDESADFRDLLRQEPEVTERLPGESLESIFDYNYYMRYVEDSFMRLGLDG
ncbi:MAG: adenylosuccinate lyase [Chloroflexota bacterium]|nr:adenylosuccinate lyase [Chloroflexota bacterium]MDE2941911.1 adenylosuccinate lyase [Chloroflexota bacterium]MDE3268382.1 adenylosuccinate lyase [Chloroflexota bacterium]